MTFRNVEVTSHQAYFTRDAVDRIIAAPVQNVRDHLAGRSGDHTLVGPGPQQGRQAGVRVPAGRRPSA